MIDTFPNYKIATNAAYHVLHSNRCYTPPLDIVPIIQSQEKVAVRSYRECSQVYGISRADLMVSSNYGFIIRRGEQIILLFNECKDIGALRFTLAHELGHIVLGHTDDCNATDKEANCFARNLLCPIHIARKLRTSEEYSAVFHVSPPMATASIAHQQNDLRLIQEPLYKLMHTGYTQTQRRAV